jgi:hypothetical protein
MQVAAEAAKVIHRCEQCGTEVIVANRQRKNEGS